MAEEPLPLFEPEDALAFFVKKALKVGFSWLDVQREEHDKAFTVAKAMTRELLEDIHQAMASAIREGKTLRQFADELKPVLVKRGWWGKRMVLDPATGQMEPAQLGSPRRLAIIYRTNMRTSYAAGRWARIQRNAKAFPMLRYVSVLDGREREEHRAWHNTILPVTDPWWETHYPPCDWGCRCRAIPLNQKMMDRRGLKQTEKPTHFGTRTVTNKRTGEVREVERGIGAGWDYHPGRSALDGVVPEPMPPGFDGGEAAASMPRSIFHQAFGLTEANGFQAVWIDASGWPVAISQRMKEGEGAARISALVETLTDPDEIRWAWVTDESGGVLLMRRYVRGSAMVDLGRLGWRIGAARKGGTVVWRRGDPVAAAARYYKRDRLGRFDDGGVTALIDSAWDNGPATPRSKQDSLNDAVADRFEAAGFNVRNKFTQLDHGYVRHIKNNHGDEPRIGHVPVTKQDVRGWRSLLSRARSIKPGDPPVSGRGVPRISTITRRGKIDFHVTTEVTRNHVILVSMHKRKV